MNSDILFGLWTVCAFRMKFYAYLLNKFEHLSVETNSFNIAHCKNDKLDKTIRKIVWIIIDETMCVCITHLLRKFDKILCIVCRLMRSKKCINKSPFNRVIIMCHFPPTVFVELCLCVICCLWVMKITGK